MKRGPIPLNQRVAAAQATLDEFRKRPFRLGRDDCVTMALFHLRLLDVTTKGLKPNYKTVAQAKAQFKKMGVGGLGELLDKRFDRIPPAAALPGDIVELEGGRGLTACAVVLTNGRVVGYHEGILDGTADVLQPREYLGAWRVAGKVKGSARPRA